MSEAFRRTFTAGPHHIDVMGHVNNAVWVQWVQDMATAHWDAVARPEDAQAFVWLVVRHEIDYRGNIGAGERVTGETWIPGEPRGATSERRVDFRNADGKVIVSALTTWAMLDRVTQRPVRVRPEVIAPFRMARGGQASASAVGR
jgi:acyl-CoA thioester hydrolase